MNRKRTTGRAGPGLALAFAVLGAARAIAAGGVPVTVATAQRADVPVYAGGLGTVAALNSALIRPRVDGTLDSVNFTEGQDVKKGDLLAVIDPRPYQAALDQATAKRAQDQASLVNARRDLARYSTLAGAGYATRQSADTQAATVQSGQSGVQGDEAAIEAAALNLSFTHIVSPIDGRVGLRQVNPGNLVQAADTQAIVVVTQLHPIGVLFTLPEENVPAIADSEAGGKQPEVQVVDSQTARVLTTGALLTTDNTINTSTGTIQLKAVFANAENRLWPGQFVQARIRLNTLSQVVTLPAQAVQRGQDGLYVYVVGPGDKAQLRPVKEYQEQDGVAAIKEGLAGGEQVVLDGQSRVSDGSALHVQQQQAS